MDEKVQIFYTFDWLEYSVFGITLSLSAFIGVYFGFFKGGQDTVSGYMFGGKKMTLFPIAMSLISSFTSGTTLLGVPVEVYSYGTHYMASSIAVIGVGIFSAFIFIPIFYKLQLVSLFEYFELRFSRSVRVVVSILFTLGLLCYVPVVIYGPALAINQVSGINVHMLSLCLCTICIFYTTVGGLKAVVWSDALQGGMMIISILAVTFIGASKVGGFWHVFQSSYDGGRIIFDMNPDPTLRISFWSAAFGIMFYWTANTSVHPAAIQRFISLPTIKQAKISVIFLVLGCLLFINLSGLIGLVMYAYYKNCDPYSTEAITRSDQMLPNFVLEVAGNVKGLPGLFLAGIVCAALSTMSTSLNTLSGAIYEDFIEHAMTNKPSDKKASQIIKILVVIIGGICVLLILVIEKLGGILEISASLGGLTWGTILGLFFLGTFFPMANTKGATLGGITSLGVMIWIFVGYRIAISEGLINYPKLPISVQGCPVHINITETTVAPIQDVFPLYKISIFLYSIIGCSVVIIVGVIVSYLTGPNKIEDIHPDLLSPLIHRFIPHKIINKYSSVPLKQV